MRRRRILRRIREWWLGIERTRIRRGMIQRPGMIQMRVRIVGRRRGRVRLRWNRLKRTVGREMRRRGNRSEIGIRSRWRRRRRRRITIRIGIGGVTGVIIHGDYYAGGFCCCWLSALQGQLFSKSEITCDFVAITENLGFGVWTREIGKCWETAV